MIIVSIVYAAGNEDSVYVVVNLGDGRDCAAIDFDDIDHGGLILERWRVGATGFVEKFVEDGAVGATRRTVARCGSSVAMTSMRTLFRTLTSPDRLVAVRMVWVSTVMMAVKARICGFEGWRSCRGELSLFILGMYSILTTFTNVLDMNSQEPCNPKYFYYPNQA